MADTNPYQPPSSQVALPDRVARRPTSILVVVLAGLQVIVSALNIPKALWLVQGGDISPLAFLMFFISTISIGLGGFVAISKPRFAMYAFLGAVVTGSLVLLQWAPLMAKTAVVVAAAAAIGCFVAFRSIPAEA